MKYQIQQFFALTSSSGVYLIKSLLTLHKSGALAVSTGCWIVSEEGTTIVFSGIPASVHTRLHQAALEL